MYGFVSHVWWGDTIHHLHALWAEYARCTGANAADVQIVGIICKYSAPRTSTHVIGGDCTDLPELISPGAKAALYPSSRSHGHWVGWRCSIAFISWNDSCDDLCV